MNHDDDFVFVCFCAARVRQVRHTHSRSVSHARRFACLCARRGNIIFSSGFGSKPHARSFSNLLFVPSSDFSVILCKNVKGASRDPS